MAEGEIHLIGESGGIDINETRFATVNGRRIQLLLDRTGTERRANLFGSDQIPFDGPEERRERMRGDEWMT